MTSYSYRAAVLNVHDGDTFTADVDLGFRLHMTLRVRLAGCNARELTTPGGEQAREHLARLLPVGADVTIASVRWDKYADRIDGRVLLDAGGPDVSVQMIEAGYAAAWNGRGKAPVPPWPKEPT